MTQANPQPIVFIPGLAFKASIWQPIANQFKQAYLIDYHDIVDFQVDNIVAHLNNNIPDNAIIVAWSLGGLLALAWCASYSRQCHQLVLVATLPKFTQALIRNFMQTNSSIKKFSALVQYPDRQLATRQTIQENLIDASQQIFAAGLQLLLDLDYRQQYRALTMPVLHIFGEQDVVVPLTGLSDLIDNPTVNVKTIKGAGHMPFVTHYAEFNKLLCEFIDYD